MEWELESQVSDMTEEDLKKYSRRYYGGRREGDVINPADKFFQELLRRKKTKK